jgi:hypothetical protein
MKESSIKHLKQKTMLSVTTTTTEWAIKVIEEDGRAEVWCDTYYDNEGEALYHANKLKDVLTNNYKKIAIERTDVIKTVQTIAVFDVTQHEE